ncbi:MAG: hypothetical protein ACON4Z_06080 [Planctomycetota bacterium]
MSLSSVAAALCAALLSGSAAGQATTEDVRALLERLDDRFERGDVRGYVAAFDPDNRGAVAMMQRRIERQIAASRSRERTSTVLVGPTSIGRRTMFRVRHDIQLVSRAGVRRSFVEDTYLTLRADGERLTPTFAVEMLPEMDCVQSDKFKCPACNYEIGGVDGFLCVPLRSERSLALESASFYLIGTDVVCDVHVQVQSRPQKAQLAARQLADAFAELAPAAEVGLVTGWVPPVHADAPPAGLDSAQVVVKLRGDSEAGDRAVFHVVTFGGLQHVLLTRGSADALDAADASLAALYASYSLIERDRDVAEAAALPLRHHLGSSFDGVRYDNARYGVTFAGPAGWRPEHRVGGARFRARWSAPDGSQLWLNGYGVPTGMEAWTRRDADRWIDHRFRERGLLPAAAQPDGVETAWHEGADGALERSIVLEQRQARSETDRRSPAAPRRRILHVQLYDDLLLIVDGYGASETSERAALDALASLRRKT